MCFYMEMFGRAASMRKKWRRRSWILTLAAALSATGAYGDVIWIGRPTVGDFMAHSVQQAIGEFRQVQGQIAQFEAQIADARQAYFAAPAASRDAAGDRFGQLLLQKDLLIAWPRVIGDDASSRMVANLMALANNGRPPDGGIPPSARQAFNQWVAAMRFHAGTGFGSFPDPVNAVRVLQSAGSMTEYEAYRRLRDQAEWDEDEAQRAGGARKLIGPGSSFSAKSYFGETPFAQNFDARIAQLPNKILQCLYSGRQAHGSVFHFWKGQAPDDIAYLMAMHMSSFEGLLDHAVDQCPPDSNQASAIASSPAKAVITPEMARSARAEKNSRPISPAEVEANRLRNEEARAKMAERQAQYDQQRALRKACSDEWQPKLNAARQARDINAQKAAAAAVRECLDHASSDSLSPADQEARRLSAEAAQAKSADRQARFDRQRAIFKACDEVWERQFNAARQARDTSAYKAIHEQRNACRSQARE